MTAPPPRPVLTAAAVALHVAVALPLALGLNVWFDEVYALDTTGHGFRHALGQALWFEEQAPLYYLLLWAWRQIADPIWFARLFSLLATAAAVLLGPDLSRRYLPDRPPWILTFLLALHPTAVWAAAEIRGYAFSLLLACLVLLTFHRAHLAPRPFPGDRRSFILVSAAALYANYFLGFLLAGLVLGRAAAGPRSFTRLRPLGADLLRVALLFLPLAICLPRQILGYADLDSAGPPAPSPGASGVPVLLAAAREWAEIGGSFLDKIFPAPTLKDWAVPRAAACAVFLAVLWSRRHRLAKGERLLWIASTVCLVLCAAAASVIGYIGWRHTSIFLPVVLPVLVHALPRKPGGTVAAFLVLYVAAIGLRHASGAKNGDYIRVAAYLEEGVAPADPVLVYDPVVAAALEPYVERPLAWRPVPRKEDFTVYGFTVHALHGPEDVLGPLGPVPPGTTVWLVQDSGLLSDRPDLRPSFAVLEAVVAARFDVVAERSFRGTRVRRLRAR